VTTFLGENQANDERHLAFAYVDGDGWLDTPDEIGFRVLDETGVQVYPAAPPSFEDVSTTGLVDVGYYTAPGNPAGGWGLTVDTRYTLEWRYKEPAGSVYLYRREVFDVVEDKFAVGFKAYTSPLDIRNAGVLVTDLSDERIIVLLPLVQQLIERACRQPFRMIRATSRFDGTHSPLLPLSIPIVGIEWVRYNDSDDDADHEFVKVYAGREFPDDRTNPRIKLVGGTSSVFPVWTRNFSETPLRFLAGKQNQRIKGVFGYLEPDGSVPALISEAAFRLFMGNAEPMPAGGGGGSTPAGAIVKEKTDRHEIQYSASGASATNQFALFVDSYTEEILGMYKGPRHVGAPIVQWEG